jgi:hypothetical protein
MVVIRVMSSADLVNPFLLGQPKSAQRAEGFSRMSSVVVRVLIFLVDFAGQLLPYCVKIGVRFGQFLDVVHTDHPDECLVEDIRDGRSPQRL